MISSPAPPPPPSPPPNPPMFMPQAADSSGAKRGAQISGGGFAGTILGQTNPANTGQKTLLGQ